MGAKIVKSLYFSSTLNLWVYNVMKQCVSHKKLLLFVRYLYRNCITKTKMTHYTGFAKRGFGSSAVIVRKVLVI